MKLAQLEEVPAAMPIGEMDDAREKLLRDAALAESLETEQPFDPVDAENGQPRGPSRKRKFVAAFAIFAIGCVAFAAVIAWFFGLGTFAPPVKQNIDRTAKTAATEQTAPATDEEKLKMALNLVAEKSPTDSIPVVTEVPREDASQVPPISLPATESSFENDPVAVADLPAEPSRSASTPTVSSVPIANVTNSPVEPAQPNVTDAESRAAGRSLFFGPQTKENKVEAPVAAVTVNPTPTPTPAVSKAISTDRAR